MGILPLIPILILFFIYIYLLIRNEKVYKFRIKTLDESIDLYYKLPSYITMLYSFKPLKKKYWIKN